MLSGKNNSILLPALVSSYISILITNFFGFSVVIQNIYLFLIPAFVFILGEYGITGEFVFPREMPSKKQGASSYRPSGISWMIITILWLFSLYLVFLLIKYWIADTSYALGNNLDKAGAYQQAADPLHAAVTNWPSEPVFQDELSTNDTVLAIAYAQQKDTTNASKYAQEAMTLSNQIITNHPNNVTFWKTRIRVLYALSQLNQQLLPLALQAGIKAQSLAPTDAKISYNVGLLYGQTGDTQKAIETLLSTTKLKFDYRDPYYALGIFYRQLATDKAGKIVINADAEQKAVYYMHYIVDHFGATDPASQVLTTWGEK